MARRMLTVLSVVFLVLTSSNAASASEQYYLNAHCGAVLTHSEGQEGRYNRWIRAEFTLTSQGDRYSQCGYLHVQMWYKYYGAGGTIETSYLQDNAYPGDYPYSSGDDTVAHVYTGVSPRIIECNHIIIAIRVGGPGGPTNTWAHLC